jgi:type IV pilus assembly protein PilC
MIFDYKAKTSSGEEVKGTEEAQSKFEVYKKLQDKNLIPISVSEKKRKLNQPITLFSSVSTHQKIIFVRNIATMLDAGLSISRALTIMGKQTRNPYFKKILENIENSIKQGKSLTESLKVYPKVFPPLFVSMVSAGEESGKLSEALNVIGDQTEKSYLLLKKVKGALIYPSIVILAMVGIGIFMLIFVVPTLTSTFIELNVELPLTTKLVIGASDLIRNNFISALLALVVIFVAIYFASKTKRGKRFLGYASLKIPVIGEIIKQVNAARTARTLSSLLSSGVTVIEALRITEDVLQNPLYKEVISKAKKKVEVGDPMSKVFGEAEDIYPIYVGEMMAVGEETGEISPMLGKVASFFEGEVDQKTKDMSTIIEPFLMIIIGLAVGFFAVSMITPMYSLVNAF